MNAPRKNYVVWNGSVERPHVESDLDYAMVTDDLKTVSVREMMKLNDRGNTEHVIVFSCAPGTSAVSTGKGGAFSLSYHKRFDWSKSFRELITEVNNELAASNFEQQAEVVAREDLLDVPISQLEGRPDCNVVILHFDMCRPLADNEHGE